MNGVWGFCLDGVEFYTYSLYGLLFLSRGFFGIKFRWASGLRRRLGEVSELDWWTVISYVPASRGRRLFDLRPWGISASRFFFFIEPSPTSLIFPSLAPSIQRHHSSQRGQFSVYLQFLQQISINRHTKFVTTSSVTTKAIPTPRWPYTSHASSICEIKDQHRPASIHLSIKPPGHSLRFTHHLCASRSLEHQSTVSASSPTRKISPHEFPK